MNLKRIAIFGAVLTLVLLGVAMVSGGSPLIGLLFIGIGGAILFLIWKKGTSREPEAEPALYEKLTKAIEGGPQKEQNLGNLILTGTKPAKKDLSGEKTIPEQAIQGKSSIGSIVNYQSIEVKIPVYNEKEERDGSKETILHAFSIVQKTGFFSKDEYIVYVYNEELLRPPRPGEDVVVQAVDVFPFTEKHCITSTSPGRKMTTFIEDLGALASTKSVLNRLGKITEETIKSNIEYQKDMRQQGAIIDYGKKSLKGAKQKYDQMNENLEKKANAGPKIDLPKGKKKG